MPIKAPEPPETIEAVPGLPVLDDIPEPITPPEALASPPEPTLQQMRDDLGCLARVVDAGLNRLPAVFQQHLEALVAQVGQLAQMAQAQSSLTAPEAGALQHLCDTLETLGARGVMLSTPYKAVIDARTPQGFRIAVHIERVDGAAFLESLRNLEGYFKREGYTPAP